MLHRYEHHDPDRAHGHEQPADERLARCEQDEPSHQPHTKEQIPHRPYRGPVHLIASVLIGLLTPSFVPTIAVTHHNARNIKES
jgi:hypothetical protein